MPITQPVRQTSFESVGTTAALNDIFQLKNGASTLKVQAQKAANLTDRYYFNWFPDNGLNPTLSPGGLYFGYEQGGGRLALNDADLVLNRNSQFIGGLATANGQLLVYTPNFGGIKVFTPGGSHSINWTPYLGLKLLGFNASATLVEIGENIGCTLRNYNASISAATMYAANNQAADLLQLKNSTGVTKLSISNDFKLSFSATNAPAPVNTTSPVAWIEIKVNGELAYIPAYR